MVSGDPMTKKPLILGRRQKVRHQTLTLAVAGSNPAVPAKKAKRCTKEFIMTDNEIIKAHELCFAEKGTSCLIKRQQSEIERLLYTSSRDMTEGGAEK